MKTSVKCFVSVFIITFQGIDINHKHDRKVKRREPKSEDIYLRLLVKVIMAFSNVRNCRKLYF